MKAINSRIPNEVNVIIDCVGGCNHTFVIPITKQQWSEIQEGTKHMQDILPNLRPDMRELFISHICPKCWDKMFGDVDRED